MILKVKILNEHIINKKNLILPQNISDLKKKIYEYMVKSGSASTGKIRAEKINFNGKELSIILQKATIPSQRMYIVFIEQSGNFVLCDARKNENSIAADISFICSEMLERLSDLNKVEYKMYLGFEDDGDVEIKRVCCKDNAQSEQNECLINLLFDKGGNISLLAQKKEETTNIEVKQKSFLPKGSCFPYAKFFDTDDVIQIVSESNIKVSEKLVCVSYAVNNKGKIEFNLTEEIGPAERLYAFYVNRADEVCIYDKAEIGEDRKTIILSYLNMEKYCHKANYLRWEVIVCFQTKGSIYFMRVVAPVKGKGTAEISEFEKHGETMQIIPYATQKGNFGFRTIVKEKKYMPFVNCKLRNYKIKGDTLYMKSECPDISEFNGKWTGICFEYRKKNSNEESEYIFIPFEADSMNTKINLKKQELKEVQWDLRHVMEVEGQKYLVRTLCPDDFDAVSEKLVSKAAVKNNSGIISMPYKTVNGYFSIRSREVCKYDNIFIRIKEHLSVKMYEIMKRYFKKKNIVLVYEKFGKRAQDNGYYFFKYCMENNEDSPLDYYFIIEKDSPDYEKVRKYGKKIIKFMSLRHMIYLLAAKGMVSSESKQHSYVWFPQGSIIERKLKDKKLVFLQHGVLAMKRVDNIFGKGFSGEANIFTVSSKKERSIVKENFGYSKNEIKITGLARWDVLEDKSEGRREILMLPTWRNHLGGGDKEKFANSEFYSNYQNLLNDSKLEKLLRDNEVTLSFYIHPRLADFIDNFESCNQHINILSERDIPLNELIMRTKAMITDYSSACWDTFYQGKPVLFWQFDREEYLESQGSYVDLETEMFGKSVKTKDELISEIEDVIQSEFKMQEKYKQMQKTELEYMDKNNCQRIKEVVTELFG